MLEDVDFSDPITQWAVLFGVVAELGILYGMSSGGMGWDTLPLSMKITLGIMTGPTAFFVGYFLLNR